jgi:predicted RNA binding protein YcfA (HicA-like mRNA interferase family)
LEVEEPSPPLEPVLKSVPAMVVGLSQVPIFLAGDAALAERFLAPPTRREMERLLRKRGYAPRSGEGTHDVWLAPDGRHFTLPAGRTVSRLVFHSFLHHLAMSKEEYLLARAAQ